METIKTISIINMKGGVGKSTLSVNLSGCLARFHDKKVLLIDNDPQANTTQYLLAGDKYTQFFNKPDSFTILDIYRDRPSTSTSVVEEKQSVKTPKPTVKNSVIRVRSYNKGHLDLVPSTLKLMELNESHIPRMEDRLKHFIDDIGNDYDYVIIDCPPTVSPFTLSAYIACQAYLVPVKSDYLSGLGLILLENLMEKYEKAIREKRQEIGVVFTLHQDYATSREINTAIIQLLNNNKRYAFKNKVFHGTSINGAVVGRKMLFEYHGGNCSAKQGKQVKEVTIEFLNRVSELEKA